MNNESLRTALSDQLGSARPLPEGVPSKRHSGEEWQAGEIVLYVIFEVNKDKKFFISTIAEHEIPYYEEHYSVIDMNGAMPVLRELVNKDA